MSNINLSLNLNDLPKWFDLVVDKFQHLTGIQVLQIVVAILFPPLAAFIKAGFTAQFWINIVLTMLGVLPGQLHALWLVLFK